MTGRFETSSMPSLTLPGRVADYSRTTVMAEDNRKLLSDPVVIDRMNADAAALPTTVAREGYFDDRHLEYWLSGYRDVQKVIKATNILTRESPRILDFGGASGRTVRHFRGWSPSSSLFLCDINPGHVNLVRSLFDDVRSFRNFTTPTLPFPDHYFDCVVAFSVFTHLNADDVGWLLELRRITKPGGYVYITVHDEATWKILPDIFLSSLSFGCKEFADYYAQHRSLTEKVVHYYSNAEDYNCNVFVSRNYLQRNVFPLFRSGTISSLAHDHQAAVVLEVP